MKSKLALAVALVLSLAACGGGGDDDDALGPPECNPLGGEACVLPWPSSIYEVDDASTATGVRLDVPAGTLPSNVDQIAVDPTFLNERDGWSASAPLLVTFPTGVSDANLPPHTDFSVSLGDASPTVIVDMETNERVIHFAELDQAAADQPARQALIIRPGVKLRGGHHYAVGIRKSLKARDGSDIPISAGFQAILDGTTTSHPLLERARPRYAATFAALEAAGVPRADLLLAWDFHTASDELVEADLLDARDAILAAAGPNASNLTITVERSGPAGDPAVTLRTIEGTFDMPLVLTDGGDDESVLNRGPDGKPVVAGTIQAPFGAVIPACASSPANRPLPVVIYGHGLMGGYDEALGGYVRWFARFTCSIVVATDWRGMSTEDLVAVANALNDVNKAPQVMEKLVQGVNQFVVLQELVRGPMLAVPEFQENGQPLIDPTRVSYYGISQGGIFGGTFMAIDPFVTRGVLGVPAANYSYILERSTNWPTYYIIIGNSYQDALHIQILLTLMQTWWDKTDPVTWVPHATGEALPPARNTPAKQILIQMAVGDCQVANIGTDYEARIMGVDVLGPALYAPYGVTESTGPLGSALTIWDEKLQPIPPLTNTSAPDDNGTHGSLRKRARVNDQIKTFFETGEIVHTCEIGGNPAPCDCTTGACGDLVL